MSIPRVDTGHDVPLVSLDPFVQEPSFGMVMPVVRNYGAGGGIHDMNLYAVFRFDVVESETLYLSILTQMNLHLSNREAVTIYARDERLQWKRYNGYAQLPQPGVDLRWTGFFPREVEVVVSDLEELAEPEP